MEYVQMTLDDWLDLKRKLRQEITSVKRSFVRIGCALHRIRDERLYEQDGYKSVGEFAREEYGLQPSTVSRLIRINEQFSIGGNSEELAPEYEDLQKYQLEEMLQLPASDYELIRPETSRESIRELKQFNADEEREKQEAERQMFINEPETESALEAAELQEAEHPEERPEIERKPAESAAEKPGQETKRPEAEKREDTGLSGLVSAFLSSIDIRELPEDPEQLAQLVNPSGNRTYRNGLYFMMMYESGIKVKRFGRGTEDVSWPEFYRLAARSLEERKSVQPEPELPEETDVIEKTEAIKPEEKRVAPAQMVEKKEPERCKDAGKHGTADDARKQEKQEKIRQEEPQEPGKAPERKPETGSAAEKKPEKLEELKEMYHWCLIYASSGAWDAWKKAQKRTEEIAAEMQAEELEDENQMRIEDYPELMPEGGADE